MPNNNNHHHHHHHHHPINSSQPTQSQSQSPFFAPHKKSRSRAESTSPQDECSPEDPPKSSLAGATFNLMNAIIGAGIVGVPYAVRECGFVWGLIMIVFCALLTTKSLRLLIGTAKHVHVPSYEMLAEAAFGRRGFIFVSLAMFTMAYGAMVTYLMIVKNVLPDLLGVALEDQSLRRTLLVLTSFCIMLPLSAQRDMANLSKTSTISVIFDAVIVFIVIAFSPATSNIHNYGGLIPLLLLQTTSNTSNNTTLTHSDTNTPISPWSLLMPSSTFFVGLGVLSFAFVCQHSAFIIAGSLKQPTRKRWATVTASALISCCILAILMGAFGYLGYLNQVQGNVLNNLGQITSSTTTQSFTTRIEAVDAVVATQDSSSTSNTFFFHKWTKPQHSSSSSSFHGGVTLEQVVLYRVAQLARVLLCTAMFFVYPMEGTTD